MQDFIKVIDERMDWRKRKMLIPKMVELGSMAYLAAGKLLTDAKMCEDWKFDDSGATDFYSWADFTLGYRRTNIQRMVDIWLAFENSYHTDKNLIMSCDFSKLALIAPICKDMAEEEKLDWIHKAQVNSCRHLELSVKEHKGLPIPQEMCLHNKQIILIEKCGLCSKILSVSKSDEDIK